MKPYFLQTAFEIPTWAEKLGVLSILAGLVWYFSNELKIMKDLRESDRKECEEKREADQAKLIAMHDKAVDAINNCANIMQRLNLKNENR